RRRHTRSKRDWSSDVCSSDLDSRSTLYAGDLAKGFEIPVIHVNADDPIACLSAARIATEYRKRFGKDFLIDVVGYRRWGHNEGRSEERRVGKEDKPGGTEGAT